MTLSFTYAEIYISTIFHCLLSYKYDIMRRQTQITRHWIRTLDDWQIIQIYLAILKHLLPLLLAKNYMLRYHEVSCNVKLQLFQQKMLPLDLKLICLVV